MFDVQRLMSHIESKKRFRVREPFLIWNHILIRQTPNLKPRFPTEDENSIRDLVDLNFSALLKLRFDE